MTRIMLYELKRIVLGEFMDDLDIANRITEAMDIQEDSSKGAME